MMFEESRDTNNQTNDDVYVPFRIRNQWFTADVRHVVAVGVRGTTAPIPQTPEYVLGYSILDGETFVTVDLASVLGLSIVEDTPLEDVMVPERLVILEANGMRIAVPVSKTGPLLTISMTQMSDVSDEMCVDVSGVMWGQFDRMGRSYGVLNIPSLLEHSRV